MSEQDCKTCKEYYEKDGEHGFVDGYCSFMKGCINSMGCQMYAPKYNLNSVTDVIDYCEKLLEEHLITTNECSPLWIYKEIIEEITGKEYDLKSKIKEAKGNRK